MVNVTTINDLQWYKNEIEKYPMLSEEEEHSLAVKYRETNDIEAAQTLVLSNLRYVVKVANEYVRYNLPMIDLIQEGNIGLMRAVKKFDPYRAGTKGTYMRVVQYATAWIKHYIHEFIINSWSLLKIGTKPEFRQLFFNTQKQVDSGKFKESDCNEMLVRMQRDKSLNDEMFLPSGDSISIQDTLVCDKDLPDTMLIEYEEENNTYKEVHEALSQLNEREQYLVKVRFMSDDKATLQDIADEWGISRERVRQIEENVKKKLVRILG